MRYDAQIMFQTKAGNGVWKGGKRVSYKIPRIQKFKHYDKNRITVDWLKALLIIDYEKFEEKSEEILSEQNGD